MNQAKNRITADGFDRVGPFHPFIAWTAVALFDLCLVLAVATTLLAGVDWTEDMIWPGGPELLPF
ncbi:hypothetical protein [Sphingomonas sp.]|uniref:hypothetical protein n=1 Tax=Sphingomonas sp. TaxID=28214 RepID=UPI002BC8179B|nr:hypothetical protein [Sphingomonas sp.]HTG39946.1 hypothetical protein [Sphingomonas sp.]